MGTREISVLIQLFANRELTIDAVGNPSWHLPFSTHAEMRGYQALKYGIVRGGSFLG